MKYEEKFSESVMHIYKTFLLNGDYLSFIALEWEISRKKTSFEEDQLSGLLIEQELLFSLPLWRFMRHGSFEIGNSQCEVGRRHALLRCGIIHALEVGKEYPSSLLAQVHANKFYYDSVEGTLGAIWVDSGSLYASKEVLDRMGILKFMRCIRSRNSRS